MGPEIRTNQQAKHNRQ